MDASKEDDDVDNANDNDDNGKPELQYWVRTN